MRQARTLYTWDCELQTGVPPQRKPKFKAETIVKFLVTDDKGKADQEESQKLLLDTLDAADYARIQDFDAEVQNQIKPLKAQVDWNKLWLPYKDEYSLTIKFQVTYLECIGRPYGLQISDYLYFFIPRNVTFSTVLGKTCGGAKPEGTTFTQPALRRTGDQASELFDALETQIDREEGEARRRALPNHFFGLDFNHEDSLGEFEDEEEEDEDESENH